MTPEFWQGKKVFITGHTGFKGSWLSLWLQTLGSEVIGYSLPAPTNPCLFDLAKVGDRMISIVGDIRDLHHLAQVMKTYQPDIVIHMAAQALVRESYKNPVDTYAVNVMGTVNMLEAARQVNSIKAIVNVTSDKCYDNQEWVWGYRESEAMGGYDPYSSSKGCSELVTTAYRNSFFHPKDYAQHGVGIATARAGNVIGGGDWASDRLIPDILRAWQSGQKVVIRYPQAIRPWQHVLEPLSGYLTLGERLYKDGIVYGGSWNFGPNESDTKTVGWIVEQMANLWGGNAGWIAENTPQLHEAHYLKLDCSKARSLLRWHPRLDVNNALTWLVNWTKSLETSADMRDITIDQIKQFMLLEAS
ncbi:CDP-glucose 4,6-dehydratase [Pseudanabaena yagii]|uniref:CDP-glucose 4,6-dehydratase n=1 Tax=Pseudanabaena yagii GIHE-NHR1 TaxID=2722753 RepID=A0ABX1LXQ0_9CYAN|nr:CDP-glucose 4,6-dehydratase [Pseudanabaena yagii]NMF60993.1 CDP-glucose 4,6-dehydratase [Pseudanabaena yagii GIHE-NHR1]